MTFSTSLSFEDKYRALIDKDPVYDGMFYTAVKTTGIFCRCTCSARKPKAENVEFFDSIKEAIDHGYRPCKVCHPTTLNNHTPTYILGLLNELNDDPSLKINDFTMRRRGVDPARVRRWFKKNYGMTFHAYQRGLRINHAFGHLKMGTNVSDIGYDSFESMSGFTEAFRKTLGFVPSKSVGKQVISFTRIDTELGPMLAAAADEGLCLLEFTDRRMLETQLNILRKRTGRALLPGKHPLFEKLIHQLDLYYKGKLKKFEIPLYMPGTEFQQKVWNALIDIPYGQTRSYQAQAIAIDQPSAVRAVARANGDNRIAIIIPCHRVIGKDGSLTGYGGGLWRKDHLLQLEKENAEKG